MTDADPLVSFIVPAWNAELTLAETIESVAGQTVGEWEVVIVDDGSTDGTARIAEGWAAVDRRIRVVSQANLGFAAARNVGLRHSRGQWISFLDADDLIESTFIEDTAAALGTSREVDLAVCGWSYLFSDGTVSDPTVFGEGAISDPLSRLLAKPIIFGSAVLRREAATGLVFDTTLRNSGDFLYWFHLVRSGARVAGVPKRLFYYRQVESSLSRRDPLRCLEQDFDVWDEVERLVPSADIPMVTRRRQIALISYACRMIAIGNDPWNKKSEAYFPLLVELPSEALAVSISEMLPIYLGKHPKSWPSVFEERAEQIRRFLENLQKGLNLARGSAELILLRLEAAATDALVASVSSSSYEEILVEALGTSRGDERRDRDPGLPASTGDVLGDAASASDDRASPPAPGSVFATAGGEYRATAGRASRVLLDYTARRLRSQGSRSLPVEIDLRAGHADAALFGAGGWATPEPWGTWTDGPEARLLVALHGEMPRDLCVEIELQHVFCPDRQAPLHVVIEVNQKVVRQLSVNGVGEPDGGVISARFPAALLEPMRGMLIVLRIQGSATPKSFGISEDTRRLGLGVRTIRLS